MKTTAIAKHVSPRQRKRAGKLNRRSKAESLKAAMAAVFYVARCRGKDQPGHQYYVGGDDGTGAKTFRVSSGKLDAELAARLMLSLQPPWASCRVHDSFVVSARARQGDVHYNQTKNDIRHALFDLVNDPQLGRGHYALISIHEDSASGMLHGHAVVARYGPGGSLRIRKPERRRLYGMMFTTALDCEEGARCFREGKKSVKKPRPKTPFSGSASRAKCVLLARRIARGEKLLGLIQCGEVVVVRRDKSTGERRSIAYEGVRIRVSTLEALIESERGKVTSATMRRTTKAVVRDAVRDLSHGSGVRVMNLRGFDYLP